MSIQRVDTTESEDLKAVVVRDWLLLTKVSDLNQSIDLLPVDLLRENRSDKNGFDTALAYNFNSQDKFEFFRTVNKNNLHDLPFSVTDRELYEFTFRLYPDSKLNYQIHNYLEDVERNAEYITEVGYSNNSLIDPQKLEIIRKKFSDFGKESFFNSVNELYNLKGQKLIEKLYDNFPHFIQRNFGPEMYKYLSHFNKQMKLQLDSVVVIDNKNQFSNLLAKLYTSQYVTFRKDINPDQEYAYKLGSESILLAISSGIEITLEQFVEGIWQTSIIPLNQGDFLYIKSRSNTEDTFVIKVNSPQNGTGRIALFFRDGEIRGITDERPLIKDTYREVRKGHPGYENFKLGTISMLQS